MKFFEWLNGPQQSEVDRALSMLYKHKKCHPVGTAKNVDHIMVGTVKKKWFSKDVFDHFNVKFSKSGSEAMISSGGTVDFFFSTKEEVDTLKKGISDKFGVKYE
jgi:hypothetical protein